MKRKRSARYPQPSAVGGSLIRQTVAAMRHAGVSLPSASHILIAVSGGADSTALAQLLARYGRRVVAPEKITLIHFNHGWRGKHSDADARWVLRLARRLGVKGECVRLEPPHGTADSWEAQARKQRMTWLRREAERRDAWILTAHQADDLAETVLWRLLTGAASTHAGGILLRDGRLVRPFLKVRKETLKRYLREERLDWKEDSTNQDPRFLRARMRLELIPVLETLFPRAISHLAELGLTLQGKAALTDGIPTPLLEGLGTLGIRLKRAHWNQIRQSRPGEIHLPEGWRLVRNQPGDSSLAKPTK